jgi:hypothetical protein
MIQILTTLQVLPQADPLPLPAYPWIFLFLLYLTLTLHFIAMSSTVGGTILLAATSFARSENMDKLSGFLAKFLPISLSFTVTLGVAPLLFIQVLYGQLFFTTSILMGWWWLLILAFLMTAYYGLYLYQHKRDSFPFIKKWMPLVCAILMIVIALLFVMNFKLFCRFPEWKEIYLSNANGWFLNFAHPQVIPSWIHHILGALAIGGLLVVLHGWTRRKTDALYGDWAVRTGGIIFALPTLLQFAVGYWLLLTLPRELIRAFMFRSAYETSILFTGMAAGTIAALLIAWSAWKRRYGWPVALSTALIIVTTALMVLKRAAVRDYLLAPLKEFNIGAMKVSPQWDTITIFGVLLIAGLAIVGWMLFVLFRGKGGTSEAA